MKRFPVFIATVMMVSAMQAADKLDLKAITSGEFAASYVTGINPVDALNKKKINHNVTPLENPSEIKVARRDIARMKTELRQRELNK